MIIPLADLRIGNIVFVLHGDGKRTMVSVDAYFFLAYDDRTGMNLGYKIEPVALTRAMLVGDESQFRDIIWRFQWVHSFQNYLYRINEPAY